LKDKKKLIMDLVFTHSFHTLIKIPALKKNPNRLGNEPGEQPQCLLGRSSLRTRFRTCPRSSPQRLQINKLWF
jgi:hypothetical protein